LPNGAEFLSPRGRFVARRGRFPIPYFDNDRKG
jgi:hypothetical protein